jgi:lipopolysaccharide transport system ATP-binding protein
MSDVAIRVENLSKLYRLGTDRGYKTFREAIVNLAKEPFCKWNGSSLQSANSHPQSDTIWALKDVSFEVKQGKVVGIIGKNGAGKSTLLKILSKITEPTSGKVELKGRVGSLLEVGTGFHSELTGHENIYLYGAILGMDRWEVTRKFDEIVAFAELEKFIDTPVKRYSSGMYTRLAFAVAAHLETEILLVDEVLAVGDMAFQKKCLGKMGDVSQEGRTVLFVSHNMAAIRKLCNNAVLLDAGRLETKAKISDCISRYLSESTAPSKLIIDHISKTDKVIQLDSVTINGSTLDHLDLPSGTQILEIQGTGNLSHPLHLDLEIRISDLYGNPLGFFSPGHEKGFCSEFKAGPFKITRWLKLPRINRGEYILSLALTTPDYREWVKIPKALILRSEGAITALGRVFDYYHENAGWVFLEDFSDSKMKDESNSEI